MSDKNEIIREVRKVIVFCEEKKAKTIGFIKDAAENSIDIDSDQVLHLLNDIIIQLHKICIEDNVVVREEK